MVRSFNTPMHRRCRITVLSAESRTATQPAPGRSPVPAGNAQSWHASAYKCIRDREAPLCTAGSCQVGNRKLHKTLALSRQENSCPGIRHSRQSDIFLWNKQERTVFTECLSSQATSLVDDFSAIFFSGPV